jgi:thiol-disulfide isomerase/thioredoxin
MTFFVIPGGCQPGIQAVKKINPWIPRLRLRGMTMVGCILVASLLRAATLNAPAPSFALKDSRKQVRTLASYKGNVVFIDFWASWCATCQLELPELDRLAAEYKGKKLQVVAINVDTDRHAAKELLKKLRLSAPHFEILWDPQSKVVSTYNIEAMPTSFILDQKKVIRFAHVSYHEHDPNTWRNEIDSLIDRVAEK